MHGGGRGMESRIRLAEQKDRPGLAEFLARAGLSAEGVVENPGLFILLESGEEELKACAGIEPCGETGLIRSFVISPGTTEWDMLNMFDQLAALGVHAGLSALYLVANRVEAVQLFRRMGFRAAADIPASLIKNRHVQAVLDVDNSVFMHLSL